MKKLLHLTIRIAVLALLLAGLVSIVLADGTETLGPPSISIASGSGIVAAGTGLNNVASGTINIDVPLGATVNQVLLYWSGEFTVADDNIITVNGNSVMGTLIGGPAFFFSASGSDFNVDAYRADITGLGLVGPGSNTLTVADMNYDASPFTSGNHGAGVLVIFDDGSGTADIEIRDGVDLSFINFPEPRKSTVPQTFTFTPATSDRTADLVIFAGSVGAENRPNSILISIDGGPFTDHFNLLGSNDGDFWDTLTLPVTIPAGASSLTVQALSKSDGSGNLPASLSWIGAGFSLPPPAGEGCTPGYWKNHLEDWVATGFSPGDDFDTTFGVDLFNPDITLEQAVNLGGSGVNKLARHGTAALLSAAHPDVDYPLDVAGVIAAVQAGDADTLEGFNELGCVIP